MIKRYEPDYGDIGMDENPVGRYVTYEDHEAEVDLLIKARFDVWTLLETEIKRKLNFCEAYSKLREENEKLRAFTDDLLGASEQIFEKEDILCYAEDHGLLDKNFHATKLLTGE